MLARRLMPAIIILALAGCAASTGILPAGPDTYTVTETFAPARGGGTEAERVALTEANTYCQQQGRVFVPVTMDQAGNLSNPYGATGYRVTFRCLLPNDPAVANFRLQRAPNLILSREIDDRAPIIRRCCVGNS